ncbi:hypothetical protein EMCRGX_G002064 [Ephydatia muelleri]
MLRKSSAQLSILISTPEKDVTTMSILKQLATEQINFNMNGYEDVIEVSEEEFTERVRGGGATPLTLPPRCHGDS